MGVCQSADEVQPIRKRSGSNNRKKVKKSYNHHHDDDESNDHSSSESCCSTTDESGLEEEEEFRAIEQAGREEAWLAENNNGQRDAQIAKSEIADSLCLNCGASVLAQSLRPLHSDGEEENPLEPVAAPPMVSNSLRGSSHFVCSSCWETYKRSTSSSTDEATSSRCLCVFCLVEPVMKAIQKYGFCDVTFARWLQVVASCTGRKNRLVCAASIIANSGEPAALASFSAAPKETAAGMIISIACILEDRFPPKRFSTACSSSFSSHSRRRRPTTPFARQLVAPKVVQLWIDARESLLSSIFGMPEGTVLNSALTRLYIRAGLSYRAFTLAGQPFTSNSLQKNVLHQIVLCAAAAAASGNEKETQLNDAHHSVESIKRAAPGLNHDIMAEYPPFMFQ